MIAFVALPVMILIAGPLASVVCMAAYFQEKVFACIIIVITVNTLVLKSPCLEDKLYPYTYISCLYESYELEAVPEDVKTQAKQDKEAMLITALFTSWISPCTVWANNIKCNSYFLLVSSFLTMFSHAVGIASIFIYIWFADLVLSNNPPITHCFSSTYIISLRFILDLSVETVYRFASGCSSVGCILNLGRIRP